jgi:hypothetical protein
MFYHVLVGMLNDSLCSFRFSEVSTVSEKLLQEVLRFELQERHSIDIQVANPTRPPSTLPQTDCQKTHNSILLSPMQIAYKSRQM